MKVFVARVEQHVYPIIEDHYTYLKVFTNWDSAEEWARSECERIMHEEFDQYIDEDEETYQWEHTDYGSSFVSNFSCTENDENHFCCWVVDEEVVCGTEDEKETVVASIEDFEIRGYEIGELSDEDKEQLLERVHDSMNNNDCVMDCFWLTIDCVAEKFGLRVSNIMTKYVYLFCHRCNYSGSLTITAYSSLKRAVKEYERMRDYRTGHPVNCVSEETKMLPVHLRRTDEIPVCHCYVGPTGGNAAAHSYYVVKKVLN